jgi:hypothetical protein
MKTLTKDVGDTIGLASMLSAQLRDFLAPVLLRLDQELDRRLVKTFAATIEVFLQQRYRASGLLLSELGAFLASPEHAPAGTKRLSNLLRSARWSADLLRAYLWRRAEAQMRDLVCRAHEVLVLWDSSVWEKPESIALEGLGSVRSSKAARLKRIRKGYYSPPAGPPVFVPGMHWISLLLMGRSGPATLAAMRWWTTRGAHAEEQRQVERELLLQCTQSWGAAVLHVFDRGYAGAPWLQELSAAGARFVIRWQTKYRLQDVTGEERPAWQFARGQRTQDHRVIWDTRSRAYRRMGVVAIPVRHWAYSGPLWLVVSRRGPGHKPWYLLTNEEADTARGAWRVILAYARRWQVEMAWRFGKSELAMESPRLWFWENRLKLLWMVSLAYAFLLSLLDPELKTLREALLRRFCPRTGKRSREVSTPLYRLRTAICFLFLSLRTLPQPQSSG